MSAHASPEISNETSLKMASSKSPDDSDPKVSGSKSPDSDRRLSDASTEKWDMSGYIKYEADVIENPRKHRREAGKRIFVNRSLQLEKIKFFGFDMDYTLAKTNILACLVNYFDSRENSRREKNGVAVGDMFMSYKSIFQDVRTSVDWVHLQGDMKRLTVDNIDTYVQKDSRVATLLDRIRDAGAKTFLLTNSDFWYTDKIMKFLLENEGSNRKWDSYFDFINVDASKPLWFAEGTIYRQVDRRSGALKIGDHMGPFQLDQVYSGGSCDVFSKMIGCRGRDVLYVGDHIFGDVLRSKKGRGWRTFLVVPELAHELKVWTDRSVLFEKLENLDTQMAEAFKNLDSASAERPNINQIRDSIQTLTNEMDMAYGILGSLFRSGSRQTFFASQVERYADLYAHTCCNLVYYPFFYFFRAPSMLMPHESTVKHEDVVKT